VFNNSERPGVPDSLLNSCAAPDAVFATDGSNTDAGGNLPDCFFFKTGTVPLKRFLNF
jgi:hypothetical protein